MTNPTLEQRARELFEIARPNFHYAKRGTADGGAFEQSEIGRCLMNAMKAIASSPAVSHAGAERLSKREQIARIIDPVRWSVLDCYLADMLRKYKGQNFGYDPESFQDKDSLAKADAILTFSHTGVEQAIEACAKVAEEYADECGEAAYAIAGAIRATLPAQSPDDIDYAGAVQGEAWTVVRTFDAATAECQRVHDKTTFASDITEDQCEWFRKGASTCRAAMGMLAKEAARSIPLAHPDIPAPSPVNVEGLVETLGPFARVAALQLPIAINWATDRPAVEWLPTGWPGWGDFLRAYEAIGGHDGIAALNDAEEARRQALASLSPDGER